MPPPVNHAIYFSVHLWLFIAILPVLALISIAAIKWRRYFLTASTASSVVIATYLLTSLSLLRENFMTTNIGCRAGRDYTASASAIGGGLRLSYETYPLSKNDAGFQIGWGAAFTTGGKAYYPSRPDRFSLVKSDFVRKTLGFELVWWDGIDPVTGNEVHQHLVIMPQWFALLFCLPAPLLAVRRHMTRRKIRRWLAEGRCGSCGFDLRAHSAGQKCPTCGNVIPTGAPSIATAQIAPAASNPPALQNT